MDTGQRISTGVEGLDEIIGGYQVGDNVIVEVDVATPPHLFVEAALGAAIEQGQQAFYVSFDRSPATVTERLDEAVEGEVTVADAFTHGKGRGEEVFDRFYEAENVPGGFEARAIERPDEPSRFHHAFDELGDSEGGFFVVESLTGMAELWGEERAREFYTHTCPRLFDTGAIALWVLNRGVHTEGFRSSIGHTSQVIVRLGREDGQGVLSVERAEGRRDPGRYERRPFQESAEGLRLLDPGDP